jgi:hypothetical protein
VSCIEQKYLGECAVLDLCQKLRGLVVGTTSNQQCSNRDDAIWRDAFAEKGGKGRVRPSCAY